MTATCPSPVRFPTRRTGIALLALILAGGALAVGTRPAAERATAPAAAAGAAEPVRIGTYDSRAVGLAFGRSEKARQELGALLAEHKEAQAAGDQARVKDLERRGASRQIRMHLQVFSNAPVEDALKAVQDQLPGVAQRANVVAIVAALDYKADTVEGVDVTDELVRLFNPTEETLRIVADLRTKAPAPIEEIAQMPADK